MYRLRAAVTPQSRNNKTFKRSMSIRTSIKEKEDPHEEKDTARDEDPREQNNPKGGLRTSSPELTHNDHPAFQTQLRSTTNDPNASP